MRLKLPCVGFGLAAIALCFAVSAQQSGQRSVWDGVYTSKQAERGDALYGPKCLGCHGEDLEGDVVEHPALAGGDFLWKWNGLTLAPLFERIHRDMPINHAGSLTRDQSADLLAYILSMNELPSGPRELPADPAALAQIRIEAAKPDRKQ